MPKIRAAAKRFGIEVSDSGRSMEGSTPMADVERRYTPVRVEIRTEGDRKRIGGYAAKFNVTSRPMGGFVEMVLPTAFNRTRGDGWPDVVARYNHDNNMLLGSTAGGTLQLRTDGTGLDYDVEPPSSRLDVLELVVRGDVSRSSFAFRAMPEGEDWALNDVGYPQRSLLDVQLVDVAPCHSGIAAYPDATAGLRSLANKMEATLEEIRTVLDEEGDLRKFFVRTDRPSKPAPQKLFGPAAAAALLARRADPWV
jgi:HK97 family phage prohead protease